MPVVATARTSFLIVRAFVVAMLNAKPSGAWDATSGATVTDKGRTIEEVTESIYLADADVCRAIAKTLGHGYRSLFLGWSAEILHAGDVPDHLGEPDAVQIKLGDNTWTEGEVATKGQILEYRENIGGVFGLNHDQPDSAIGGHYSLEGNTLYLTGLAGRLKLATFAINRDSLACQSPDAFTSTVMAGAMMRNYKPGDRSREHWRVQFEPQIAAIEGGAMVVPAIQLAEEARG